MITKMFAVHDSKVGAYLQPFFCRTRGEALRSFMDAAGDRTTMFHKFPGDYTLFEVGDFDDVTGTFQPLLTPDPIANAINLLQEDK